MSVSSGKPNDQSKDNEVTEKSPLVRKCPKCGYERTKKDDAFISAAECPKCGVIYKKEEEYIAKQRKRAEEELLHVAEEAKRRERETFLANETPKAKSTPRSSLQQSRDITQGRRQDKKKAEIKKTHVVATVVLVVFYLLVFVTSYMTGAFTGRSIPEKIAFMIGISTVPLITYIVYSIYPKHNGAKYVYYIVTIFFIITYVIYTLHILKQSDSRQLVDPWAGRPTTDQIPAPPPRPLPTPVPAPALISPEQGQEHFDRIRRAHPAFGKYRDDGSLKKWIEKQPAHLREEMQRVYNEGDSDAVIVLFNQFKKANNIPIVEAPVRAPSHRGRIKIPKADVSITRSPEKQSQTSMKNAKPSKDAGQHYIKGLKGIELMNGNVIEGQIISVGNIVKIRTKDGKVLSYSYLEEVRQFIAE